MGILFTIHMGFLLTITMGILFTIVLGILFTLVPGIQLTISTFSVSCRIRTWVQINLSFGYISL
jgi:hypothetical protein